MSQIDDGGPAFPTNTENTGNSGACFPNYGMTLRDYFIAHAPAEPWRDFKPEMTPMEMPSFNPTDNDGNEATKEERDQLLSWHAEPHFDIDKSMPAFYNWCEQWREYWAAYIEFKSMERMQRRLQWPAYWADRMIEQRMKA